MPFWFGLAIVLFIIGLIALVISFIMRGDYEGERFVVRLIAGIGIGLGMICTIISSANSVPVRNVGIVTSFNRPTGKVTGSGLKWVAPWKEVGEWDASRQRYDHLGDKCVSVRTGTLANACVETLIEWQVKSSSAPEQFMAYKGDFSRMVSTKIDVNLAGALNDAFSTYNPLSKIDEKSGNLNVDLKPYVSDVTTKANERLGSEIEILSVTITRINHDEKTEANIKAFQDKLAEARNLEQDRKNAEVRKLITETNAKTDAVTRCMDNNKALGLSSGPCLQPGFPLIGK